MKRILATLMTLALLLCVLTLTAMAAEEQKIVVEQVTAQAGASVDVDVALENNPGINTFTLSIEYDKERLQLTGLTMDAGLGGNYNYSENTEAVTWLASADTNYNGTALTLHFTVLENAPNGDAAVTVTYGEGNICNYDEEDVNFTVCPGGVTVAHTHSLDIVPATEATCEEVGHNTFYFCNLCNKVLKVDGVTETTAEAEAIPALGHDMSDPTCTEAPKCQREGCDYTQGEALGHDWIAATCLAAKHCDRCGLTEGEPLPHTEGAWQMDDKEHWKNCETCAQEIAGTRQAHADQDGNSECDLCGKSLPKRDPENPATGDFTNPWLLGSIMMVSLTACVALVTGKKKFG